MRMVEGKRWIRREEKKNVSTGIENAWLKYDASWSGEKVLKKVVKKKKVLYG